MVLAYIYLGVKLFRNNSIGRVNGMIKAIGVENRLMMDDGIAIAVLEDLKNNLEPMGIEIAKAEFGCELSEALKRNFNGICIEVEKIIYGIVKEV